MIVNSSRAKIKKLFHEEGIMARIRVNTEDLKTKARDFDSAADAFNRAGDDILAAALAMPSYDGQLSGPARKAGYEIQTQCRELKAALSNNAESIRKAALGYEEVDNQAIDTFAVHQEALSIQTASFTAQYSMPEKTKGGTEQIGYQYISDDYVVIWLNGKYMRIQLSIPPLTETEYQSVMDFINYINEYDNYKDDMKDALIAAWKHGGTGLLAIIGAAIITGAVGAATAALAALGVVIGDTIDEVVAFFERLKKFHDAANEFNELYQSGNPEITVQ